MCPQVPFPAGFLLLDPRTPRQESGERALLQSLFLVLLDLSDSRAGICSARAFFCLFNRCLWASNNQGPNEMHEVVRLQAGDV